MHTEKITPGAGSIPTPGAVTCGSFPARTPVLRANPLQGNPLSILISVLQLRPLARIHNLFRINGILIHLFFQDLSVFADQEVHAASGLIFILVDSVLASRLSTPVAQQWEGNSNLVGEGFVGEGAIHAHTH